MNPDRPAVRVAAGQMLAQDLAHASVALESMKRLAERAAQARATLLVLPECSYPAYWLGSAREYQAAHVLPTPALLDRLSELARRHRLYLVCGLIEESGDRLFNAAAVIDPAGTLIGVARKTFLWDCDNRWFSPGDRISVFETPLGRIGVQICADARAPETTATLVARGAELIAMPTAWVDRGPAPESPSDAPRAIPDEPPPAPTVRSDPTHRVMYNIQPDFLIESRAREFHVPFICADKAGLELPLGYVGQSMIVAAGGRVLQKAPMEGESLVVDDLVPAGGRPPMPTPAQREQLLQRCVSPASAVPPRAITLSGMLKAGTPAFQTGDARAATITGAESLSFVQSRCLALRGVQVLCVSHAPHDLPVLRTRAAENRVFVIAVSDRFAAVLDPTGRILAEAEHGNEASATVNISEADIKRFTPETDIWSQRRTACYALGAERPDAVKSSAS